MKTDFVNDVFSDCESVAKLVFDVTSLAFTYFDMSLLTEDGIKLI